MVLMFQKEFEDYDEMIKYLSNRKVDKADFEVMDNGKWVLNIIQF